MTISHLQFMFNESKSYWPYLHLTKPWRQCHHIVLKRDKLLHINRVLMPSRPTTTPLSTARHQSVWHPMHSFLCAPLSWHVRLAPSAFPHAHTNPSSPFINELTQLDLVRRQSDATTRHFRIRACVTWHCLASYDVASLWHVADYSAYAAAAACYDAVDGEREKER